MRILYVSPTNAIGGAEMSLLQMAKYLHQNGHTVFVAMPPSAEKDYEHLLQPFVESFLFVPLMAWNRISQRGLFQKMKAWAYRLYKSRGGWLNAPLQIADLVRRNNIELIHSNTIMTLDGALAAKITGLPHLQHLREITGYSPDALFPMLGQGYPKTFRNLMTWLHTVVIVNSKYVGRASATLYSTEKIKLAYNLFSDDFFQEKKAPKAKKNAFNIGLVANVTAKWKNHAMLIELAKMILKERPATPCTFSFYGKIPPPGDPYFQQLQNQIQAAQLQHHVHFKGLYNQHKMYDEIDILFHTAPNEFFGRIFVEAMAQKIPVVAVRGGGADELIIHGDNGFLFEKNDIEAAKLYVLKLQDDHDLYTRIADSGWDFAQQFRSEVTGAALLEIYREILN